MESKIKAINPLAKLNQAEQKKKKNIKQKQKHTYVQHICWMIKYGNLSDIRTIFDKWTEQKVKIDFLFSRMLLLLLLFRKFTFYQIENEISQLKLQNKRIRQKTFVNISFNAII